MSSNLYTYAQMLAMDPSVPQEDPVLAQNLARINSLRRIIADIKHQLSTFYSHHGAIEKGPCERLLAEKESELEAGAFIVCPGCI